MEIRLKSTILCVHIPSLFLPKCVVVRQLFFLKEDKVIVFYHINVSLCQEYRKFSGILGGTT